MERFGYTQHGGTLAIRHRDQYVVNAWSRIIAGGVGTQELQNVNDMRLEIANVFRRGQADSYGGSLSPFGVVLPLDAGVPRHEFDKTPRLLRYELTLVATRDEE